MNLKTLAKLDDRTKLLLIDFLTDSLSDELAEEIHDGLAVAFERDEEARNPAFTLAYPVKRDRAAWQAFRASRDVAITSAIENADRFAHIASIGRAA